MTRKPGSLPGNQHSAQLFDGESPGEARKPSASGSRDGKAFYFPAGFLPDPFRRQRPPREREKESSVLSQIESRKSKVQTQVKSPKSKVESPARASFEIVLPGLLSILLCAAAASAATIRGTVLDPAGRAVPGARVSLLAPLTVVEERQTDAQGRYEFAGLRGGAYKLVANMPGFSTASSELEVSDTATATANLRLEISAVDERVVVSASLVGALAPEIGSSVSVVDQAEIKDRGAESVLDVLRGVPGVEVNQTARRGGATGVFIRGGNSDYDLVMIDGIQVTQSGGDFDFASLAVRAARRRSISSETLMTPARLDLSAPTLTIYMTRRFSRAAQHRGRSACLLATSKTCLDIREATPSSSPRVFGKW